MEKKLANKIIAEISEVTKSPVAIVDTDGNILSKTKNFSITHKLIDTTSPKVEAIKLDGKKIGFVHVDEPVKRAQKTTEYIVPFIETLARKKYLDEYLTTDEKRIDQVIYDFLNDLDLTGSDFSKILRSFKIKVAANRIAILLEINDPDYLFLCKKSVLEGEREQVVKRTKRRISEVLNTFYTRYDANIVTYMGRNNFLILKDMGKDPKEYQPEFKKTLSSFHFDIEQELRTKITMGVGDFKTEIIGLRESFEESQTAISFGKQIWGEGRVFHYDNFGVIAPLYMGANTENITFSKKIIKKLHLHDDLYLSIEEYFKNNLSLTKTAKKLNVHRNTLVYRLERVSEITGFDPKKFDDAFQLKIALILEKYDEDRV